MPPCWKRFFVHHIHRGRGTARAEDTQWTPTQSHISPRILVYDRWAYYWLPLLSCLSLSPSLPPGRLVNRRGNCLWNKRTCRAREKAEKLFVCEMYPSPVQEFNNRLRAPKRRTSPVPELPECQIPYIQPETLLPKPYTTNSTLYTLHSTLYTVHPEPYKLYTLHSTLYILHPNM